MGFVDVVADDRTSQFIDILNVELNGLQERKSGFLQQFEEHFFDYIIDGWQAKLVRCAAGDQTWGLFTARKPDVWEFCCALWSFRIKFALWRERSDYKKSYTTDMNPTKPHWKCPGSSITYENIWVLQLLLNSLLYLPTLVTVRFPLAILLPWRYTSPLYVQSMTNGSWKNLLLQ